MTRCVNLIPTPLQRRRHLLRRRTLWAKGTTSYAAVLVFACAAWRLGGADNLVELGDQIARAESDTATKNAELSRLRAGLAQHRSAMRLGEALAARPDWSELLALVARGCAADVVLRRAELSAASQLPPVDDKGTNTAESARSVLRLNGLALSQAAVTRFALKLEQTGVFEAIEPSSSRESFDGSDAVAFHLDCWLLSSTRPSPKQPDATQAATDASGVTP